MRDGQCLQADRVSYDSTSRLYFFWLPLLFAALVWAAFQASSAVNTALLGFQGIVPLHAVADELRS